MQETRFADHALHCELASYHEAAHAVVALHYGRVVKEVRILHHFPGNGWVKWVRAWFPDAPDTRNPRDTLRYWTHVFSEVEREVKIMLAGPLAEAKLLRTPLRSLGARSDLQRALAAQEFLDNLRESLRDTLFIPGDQTAHFLERMRRQTRRLIAQPWCWNAITVLAKDVMDWHHLSGHDVAETVQWSMKPRRQLSLSLGNGGQTGAAPEDRRLPRRGFPAHSLRAALRYSTPGYCSA